MQTISRKDPSSTRVFNKNNAFYIVGFVDGEGSFNISFKIREDYKHKVQIYPSFNISQKERRILEWIKHYLNCGTIRNRGDGVYYYEVHNLKDLVEKIIPFFNRYKLRTRKQSSLQIFSKIVLYIYQKKILSFDDIKKIYFLRDKIKVGRKRKYSVEDLERAWESSETICQTREYLDDIVRPA